MSSLKRILILSASYGEGHQQAAMALREALRSANPQIDVQIMDYMRTVHPVLDSVARYCYLKSVRFVPQLYGLFYKGTSRISPSSVIQRRLNHLGYDDLLEFLRTYRPDLVLATFPTPAGVMSLLKERGLTSIMLTTIITDHAIHSQWIHPYTDHYFVGSEHVKDGLIARGVPEERISVSGIPIRPAFLEASNRSEILHKLGLAEDLPTLLVMGGAYGVTSDIAQICEELFQSDTPAQILVVCGRNERLRQHVTDLQQSAKKRVLVYGYTREVHELMAVSDLIITKAGGLTISEALAMELPMILYRPIPGQEVQNAFFLVKSRVARLARTRRQVVEYAEALLKDGGVRLQKMREHTNTISKLTAARDIAGRLIELGERGPAPRQLAAAKRQYAD